MSENSSTSTMIDESHLLQEITLTQPQPQRSTEQVCTILPLTQPQPQSTSACAVPPGSIDDTSDHSSDDEDMFNGYTLDSISGSDSGSTSSTDNDNEEGDNVTEVHRKEKPNAGNFKNS